jgi:hypothetical protein
LWKLFYRGYFEAKLVFAARQCFSTAWGRCPAVVKSDISGKVGRRWKAKYMDSLFAGSNSGGFFSCGRN